MKNVLFYLGPTTGLSARQLTITRQMRAGDDAAPAAEHNADAGAVDNVTVALPSNTIWEAKLVDTRTSGETSDPQLLFFNTGSLQFPGKSKNKDNDPLFRVLAMEDLSSSSSSASSSSSSSSSSNSSSSSSSSSVSSSSVSSSSSSSSSSVSSSSVSSSSSSSSSSP